MKDNNLNEEFWNSIKERILNLIEKHHRPADEVILDDVDLRNLLKISRRTSLEYRRRKFFPAYKLEGKIFYILSEVLSGIKKHRSNEKN